MLPNTSDFEQIWVDHRAGLSQVRDQVVQDPAEIEQLKGQLQALSASLENSFSEGMRALTALYRIVTMANRVESLELFLNEALSRAMDALNSSTGIVVVFEDGQAPDSSSKAHVIVERGQLPGAPHQQGTWLMEGALLKEVSQLTEPLIIADIRQDSRVPLKMRHLKGQLLLAPMRIEGHTQGVVGLLRQSGSARSEGELAILSSITHQIGIAVQQLELRKQAQRGRLLEERERLGRDLHDTITQSLYGLAALAEAGDAQLESGDIRNAQRTLKRIGQTTRQALREMRLFIHELRPDILEQNGLVAALQLRLAAVEGRSDMQARLIADEPLKLPREAENALYRIAIEALNNCMRHANADHVTIRLYREQTDVFLEIKDDGRGFTPDHVGEGGMGLENIRHYAKEVDAKLQIISAPAKGTTIGVVVKNARPG